MLKLKKNNSGVKRLIKWTRECTVQRWRYLYGDVSEICLFHFHRRIGMKSDWGWECWGIYMGIGLAQAQNFPLQIPPTFPKPVTLHTHLPERWNTQCFETSAYKIQTSGNYPGESIKHSWRVCRLVLWLAACSWIVDWLAWEGGTKRRFVGGLRGGVLVEWYTCCVYVGRRETGAFTSGGVGFGGLACP